MKKETPAHQLVTRARRQELDKQDNRTGIQFRVIQTVMLVITTLRDF